MPCFDGTGPQGKGPMSGGCRGFCVIPVFSASRDERNPKEELLSLKSWAEILRKRLQWIDEQLQKCNEHASEEEVKDETRNHGT